MPHTQPELTLCHAATSQLIIVDVQERLATSMPKRDLDVVIANINRLSKAADLLDIPVIVTEQYPKGLGPTIDAVRDHLPADLEPLQKTGFSTCSASGFEQRLTHDETRKQIILVGIEAHICVLQTASGLQHWGYQVFVAADGVCSRTPANRDNGLARMRQSGIQITNAESVAFEWMGDATHERFKEVAALFK